MGEGIIKTSVLLAIVTVIAGCTVGPDFVRPETETAEAWLELSDPKVTNAEVVYADWWSVFEDSILDKLIADAYQQNLPLQIAAVRVLEARAGLGVATGLQFPQQQTVGGQAAKVGLSENAPNVAIVDQSFYDFQLGFDSVWELDIWGRFRRGVEAAEAEYLSAVANYDNALVTLTAEIARMYILFRTFEARLQLARNNVEIQQETLRIAEVRYRNGAVTELDMIQALALLRDTQALVPAIETGIRQTRHAISTLLGRPPGEMAELLEEPRPIPSAPVEIAVGAPVDLLRRRPDVRFAELQAAAQSARIGIAQSELYPRFALFGSIGLASSEGGGVLSNNANAGDLFKGASRTYTVGSAFSWPIFNFGRLRNQVRIQDARFQQAALNYQNKVLEAAREVEDALAAYLLAQVQVDFLAESVDAANRSVELSLIEYRAGSVNYQRVLDAQRFLVQQQDKLTRTRGDIVLNLIATYKALGGGWEIRKGLPLLSQNIEDEMRARTNWDPLLPSTLPTQNQGTAK